MTENLVELRRTNVEMKPYARALARAWRAALGSWPTKEQAGVLWAQYGIETGAGPWCWNFNIGNVKHVTGDGHDYVMLHDVFEMIGGERVVFQPPHPATWFRAFPSLDESMAEHFAFLRGKRYRVAWPAVEAGDCGLFARLLHDAGYFTTSATSYALGMGVHFARWMALPAFDDALAQLQREEIEAMPPFQIVHVLPGAEE